MVRSSPKHTARVCTDVLMSKLVLGKTNVLLLWCADGQKPTGSSGGLFQFMRGSKTTGEQEGMYLDDLQADKEVAALHLYSQG